MPTLETPDAHKKWLRELPTAPMVYPTTFTQKVRYYFWRVITPLHSYIRDFILYLGLWKHDFRQEYLIGMLAPGQPIQELVDHLIRHGYGTHFIAWRDPGEVVSLRHVDTFTHQHHIRVFDGGEVRVHYEYTPEYRPIHHMLETGMEFRREDFLALLGDRIVPLS